MKGECIPIAADMQKLSDVENLVKEIKRREKALHVLVNNAGVAWAEDIEEYSVRGFRPASFLSLVVLILRI